MEEKEKIIRITVTQGDRVLVDGDFNTCFLIAGMIDEDGDLKRQGGTIKGELIKLSSLVLTGLYEVKEKTPDLWHVIEKGLTMASFKKKGQI